MQAIGAEVAQAGRVRLPEDEGGIMWNDPAIGVEWPLEGLAAAPAAKEGGAR